MPSPVTATTCSLLLKALTSSSLSFGEDLPITYNAKAHLYIYIFTYVINPQGFYKQQLVSEVTDKNVKEMVNFMDMLNIKYHKTKQAH